jgi:reactive intermediate/imine deaminase
MKYVSIASLSVVVLAGIGFSWVGESKGATQHRFLNVPGRSDNNPYSNAVLVGDTLYLAGDIGIDPQTGAPPAEIKDEVRILMDQLKARLEMVDMTMDDLVMVNVYCPDLSLYGEFNEIYRSYFTDHFPARAFLGSGPLLLGGHFEMTAVAVRQ